MHIDVVDLLTFKLSIRLGRNCKWSDFERGMVIVRHASLLIYWVFTQNHLSDLQKMIKEKISNSTLSKNALLVRLIENDQTSSADWKSTVTQITIQYNQGLQNIKADELQKQKKYNTKQNGKYYILFFLLFFYIGKVELFLAG